MHQQEKGKNGHYLEEESTSFQDKEDNQNLEIFHICTGDGRWKRKVPA